MIFASAWRRKAARFSPVFAAHHCEAILFWQQRGLKSTKKRLIGVFVNETFERCKRLIFQ